MIRVQSSIVGAGSICRGCGLSLPWGTFLDEIIPCFLARPGRPRLLVELFTDARTHAIHNNAQDNATSAEP